MIRLSAALALLGTALLAALPVAAAPALRVTAAVEGSVIRLGDLFTDAGAHAGDVVAPSPPPGSSTIFDANWLEDAAREHGLAWEPASRFDRATVERATRIVASDEILDRLRKEIALSQPIDRAQLSLDNPAFHLMVAKEAPDAIAVEGLSVDPRSGRFSAFVSAPADDPTAERQRVTGRFIRMTRVSVLNRPVSPGEIIAAGDIETMETRADRIGPDILVDAGALVGKTPRHALRAHEPLHLADVQAPLVVHKDDLVTVLLETSALRLTTQGKALEDGAMHATIRIANTKSNRVIDAVVTGPNLVAVAPPALLAGR